MRNDAIWLDDDGSDDQPRRPRHLVVLAIAAIPWIIVAALVLMPDRDPDPPGDPAAGDPADGAEGHTPLGADVGHGGDTPLNDSVPESPTDGSGLATPDTPDGGLGPGPRVPGGAEHPADEARTRDALAGTATVVARAWLTGVAPHLDVPGLTPPDPTSYAEHVAVEAVDRTDPDLAVVTVLAVLLRETADGLRADTRRVAVPLALDNGQIRPVGPPWWLPSPDLRSAELPSQAQTDPAWFEAAADSLRLLGFEDVEVVALERTDRWPWRAEVRARTPDGERVDGPLWLRWTGQAFILAGIPPAGPPPPSGEPSSENAGGSGAPTNGPEVPPGSAGSEDLQEHAPEAPDVAP